MMANVIDAILTEPFQHKAAVKYDWDACGPEHDTTSMLMGTLTLPAPDGSSYEMHLAAYAVDDGGETIDGEAGVALAALHDCDPITMTIHGREYALIATPFAK